MAFSNWYKLAQYYLWWLIPVPFPSHLLWRNLHPQCLDIQSQVLLLHTKLSFQSFSHICFLLSWWMPVLVSLGWYTSSFPKLLCHQMNLRIFLPEIIELTLIFNTNNNWGLKTSVWPLVKIKVMNKQLMACTYIMVCCQCFMIIKYITAVVWQNWCIFLRKSLFIQILQVLTWYLVNLLSIYNTVVYQPYPIKWGRHSIRLVPNSHVIQVTV